MPKLIAHMLPMLPRSIAHKIYYKSKMGHSLKLNSPCDINEKLQWLMVYEYGRNVSKYADKYAVREYVKECGCESILTRILGVYDSFDDIDFDTLPERFVIKTTHAAGKGFYTVCTDKSLFSIEQERAKFMRAMKSDYSRVALEYHYRYIKRRIIIEEYIEPSEADLRDYKFFCMSGKVNCVLVCSDRKNEMKRDYYDPDWNRLAYTKPEYSSSSATARPELLPEMIRIAETLSKKFCFARIDLYCEHGQIYFGEITLTPAAGVNRTYTDKAAKCLGDMIVLPNRKGENNYAERT